MKRIKAVFFILALGLILTACAEGNRTSVTLRDNSGLELDDIVYLDEDESDGVDLTSVDTGTDYMITSIDKKEKVLAFCRIGSDRSYRFRYDAATVFLNKFGDYMSVDDLRRGRVVFLGPTDSNAVLTLVRIADDVWYQEDVTNFKVVGDEGYMLLGQDKYRLSDTTRVFWRKTEVGFDDISEHDTLAVTGFDRDIYSIRITKGHGTLVIYNTEFFKGGWLSLGSDIYTAISGDMTMELPHGVYTLSVANKGWGDTKKIKIEAGKITKVDLDEYRGEGPEKSMITFEINVGGAVLSIDGEETDYSEPVEVTYGIHTLTIKAPGYERWENRMVVHSKEANIVIGSSELTEDGTEKAPMEEENENSGEAPENEETEEETDTADAGGTSENTEETGVSDSSVSSDDASLETLRELLRSLLDEE